MPNTTSWAWPNLFNISQNRVSVFEDNQSIVSRCRLLMLTEPTELYHEPNQGVGLKRFMYRYNTDNVKAEICDRCKDQFALHEPSVHAPDTEWAEGLKFSGSDDNIITPNEQSGHLKMTISVKTIYGDVLQVTPNDIIT